VRKGERKGWEEKRREGKKGERTGRDGREDKNVLPHSEQAVADIVCRNIPISRPQPVA